MDEIWKDIDNMSKYEVSNKGRVRNKKTGRFMTSKLGRDGRYLSVFLTNDGVENTYRVHRLVAETFLGKHPGMVVNHKDGDKLNNHLENLEWCTCAQNNRHAIDNGLNHPGAYQKRKVIVIETGEIYDGVCECANAIGADFRNVYAALQNKTRHTANGFHFEYVDGTERTTFLRDYQMAAIENMSDGCILNGGVGSGKSRTGLYYYFSQYGGRQDPEYVPMVDPPDLYILTTAMKRDSQEWLKELSYYLLSTDQKINRYGNKVVVDSWNNIKKYADVKDAFFIFDEDKVTGSGAWVKAFLKIAKHNRWIILSATAGDCWMDYVPVFIANGFYKNKTEFVREHVVYSQFTKYPKVDRYTNTGRLLRLRNKILVGMDFKRETIAHHEDVYVRYDISKYKDTGKYRWDPFEDEPIRDAAGLCRVWRRIVNSDESRQVALLQIFENHPKMIVFYNFDYELDILKGLYYGDDVEIAEWNGHKHQDIPRGARWVYLVQYNAGAEGWNCIRTDTIVFYSQNYSYKIMQQSAGRIDRLNTPYTDLYYYHFKSRSGIDLAISKALREKKNFNEGGYMNRRGDFKTERKDC